MPSPRWLPMSKQPKAPFVLIAFAGLSLLAGLWAGIVRLGWELPVPSQTLPFLHGPLMVVGFLGTLIGLERAVAMGYLWPYGAPLFTVLSVLSVLAGAPLELGAILAAIGSLIMLFVFIALYRQSPSAHFVTMALSSAAWVVGNCLWLLGFWLYSVVPWWIGFLVLMIAGERLELSRVMQPSAVTRALFHACTVIVLSGLLYSTVHFPEGIRVAGIGLAALSLWLMRHDVVRRTIREPGLRRFMALCLLTGYFWLAAGGLLWVLFAREFVAGLSYDAMLHSIFLGFVFAMIFAHAPVILPSITGIALPYHPRFYVHLVLLDASLLLRVGGDMTLWVPGQQWGGMLNVLAVLLFLINNIYAARASYKGFISA
jgi:hypothetical protein